MKSLPNDVDFKAEEGGVVLSLNDNGDEAAYSAVELVAMVLSSAQVRSSVGCVFCWCGRLCSVRSEGRMACFVLLYEVYLHVIVRYFLVRWKGKIVRCTTINR